MTPREQIEKAMKESIAETIYASGWGVTPQATDLLESAYTKGAEYGYNLALERVCEYLKFFINVPDEVETNENGEPLATSFLEVSMKRIKAAEDFANDLKQAMKL